MTFPGTRVKCFGPFVLLILCSGSMQANVVESLSIDLSALNAGSILSGSTTLANPLTLGGSTQISLSFSDPADYTPTALTTTLSVTSGTPTDQFRFSTITFTNIANNKTYNLMVVGAAACVVDFPCVSTGGFQANSPPAFSGTYTITAANAPTAIPEPSYGLLVSGLIGMFVFGRRLLI